MPAFDLEVLDASLAIDAEFAGDYVFSPFALGADRSAPEAPDSTRLSAPLVAIFVDPEARPVMPNSWDTREYRRPGVESSSPHLEISAAELTRLGPSFTVKAGDQFQRVDDGAVYRVKAIYVTPNGTARVKINKIG